VRSFPHRSTFLLLGLAFLLTGFPTGVAHGRVEIVRLWTGYKDASAFVRLRELITGKEVTGRTLVMRSDPSERAGFYYTLRLAERDARTVPEGSIVLHVIPPDAAEPQIHKFPFAAASRRQARMEVGLTGEDWTFGKTMPLAWRLEVQDAAGRILDSRESYLWSQPAPEPVSAPK
jgi:hypothetical protein